MKSEFISNITTIRAVEDCIRATGRYTEGLKTVKRQHPVQGEEFPSKVFCKFYEVSPKIKPNWDMPVGVALDWLWGDTPLINITFSYDYRKNKAELIVYGGQKALDELIKEIPGFNQALANVIIAQKEASLGENQHIMADNNRHRVSSIPRT